MQGCCDYVDSGQAAIDLVANSLIKLKQNSAAPWSYSLILLDYSMPKMDGPTTAMHICELYKKHGVEIPHIVCLTAFTEKIFEDKARESGMAEFIFKPINKTKLNKIMRECHLINQAEAN